MNSEEISELYAALKRAGYVVAITPGRNISVQTDMWLDKSPRVSPFCFGDSFSDHDILYDRTAISFIVLTTGAHTVTHWEFSK